MPPDTYVHPTAIIEPGATVGEGSRVWAFCHILPGASLGRDCNVCDHVFIEGGVELGDRVTVKCGVQLWTGIVVEDDVFIGPNATFTNDPFPRSKERLETHEKTLLQRGASVGANATILPGLVVGTGAMVGAGCVVTSSVPPHAIVSGNPARIQGYSTRSRHGKVVPIRPPHGAKDQLVGGARLIALPAVADLRGVLSFAEVGGDLPFAPLRYFLTYEVSSSKIRGEHAHRTLEQFLVCAHGSCHVVLDDGMDREEVVLDDPRRGLYVPPLVWLTHYKYTPDAVLLVLASQAYDADDYLRDYREFAELARSRRES